MIRSIYLREEGTQDATLLIYTVPSHQRISQDELEEVSKGLHPFLSPVLLQKDGKQFLCYKSMNQKSLVEYLGKPLTKEEVIVLLRGILEGIEVMESRGLRHSQVVVHFSHIYINPITKKLSFLYVPTVQEEDDMTLTAFCQELISSIIFNEQSEGAFFIQLHNLVVSKEAWTIELLRKLVQSEQPLEMEQSFYERGIENQVGSDEGYITSILSQYEETPEVPALLYPDSKKRILLTKDAFVLGRDPLHTDYTLNNGKVGRVHATIYSRVGRYYVKDQESTNGTYINGIRLDKGGQQELKDGDTLMLADQMLRFKI